ncbi:MAG: hypothetical protein AABZ60_02355 [Planctomycetota bacterium]
MPKLFFKPILLLTFFCTFFSFSFAWGRVAHEWIAILALKALAPQELREWLIRSQDDIGYYSTLPEVWKSQYSQERSLHWFHLDDVPELFQYKQFPSFQNFLEKFAGQIGEVSSKPIHQRYTGALPWRIEQLYLQLVNQFRQLSRLQNRKRRNEMASEIIYTLGILAHYTADLSQPYHLTGNYDGQLTGNPGFHKYYEFDLVEAAPEHFSSKIDEQIEQLYSKISRSFARSQSLQVGLLKTAKFVYDEYPVLNEMDQTLSLFRRFSSARRSPETVFSAFEEKLSRHIAIGIILQSCLIQRAYEEAGEPSLKNAFASSHANTYIFPEF